MSLFKEEITASEGEELYMGEFSEYTIQSKFPNTIDGLKPIHRRILLTLHDHYQGETPKEATVAGRVMAMHPHGDAAIAQAIAGLAKPYDNIIPLVESGSNLGTYDGEPPGAPRYVDVAHAESSEDLFFKGTNFKVLRMVPCESEYGMEPSSFVPVVPTTLIFPVLGIGSGFKTETNAISVANMCKVAKKFIELKYVTHRNDYMKHTGSLAQYLLPDFPVYCTLRNPDQIIREYSHGNFSQPYVIDGILTLTKDSIIVTSLPPKNVFGKMMYSAGEQTQKDKNSWFHEHFLEMKDLGGKQVGALKGNYVCTLRRGENPFELVTMFKKLIQFTSTWEPSRLYYDMDDGLTSETPITLLDKWANRRYQVVLGGLKQRLQDLFTEYRKVQALLIIVDHAMEVAAIFNKATDEDATVQILVKKYGLTAFQAKYLQSLPLRKLTAKGKKELQDQIEQIKKENAELQKKFTTIHQEMLNSVNFIENKYAKQYPAKCTSPKFIATACYKNNGWIMLESVEEADKVLKTFGTADIKFSYAQYGRKYTVVGSDDPSINPNYDVPKYIHATSVEALPSQIKYLGVYSKGGASFVVPPKMVGMYDLQVVPVGQKCTIITKEGRQLIEVTPKVMRQSIKAETPAIRDVIHISPVNDEEVFVVHGNPKVPGVINIDRINGNGKISRVPIGQTVVIGVYRVGSTPIMFSIPDDIAVRTSIKHMYFSDLSKFVAPNSTLKLHLVKRRDSNERPIATINHKSQLYTICG